MREDTSYDYPGSEDSLGRRRRRGLATVRSERTTRASSTFHAPHLEVHEANHHSVAPQSEHERILE